VRKGAQKILVRTLFIAGPSLVVGVVVGVIFQSAQVGGSIAALVAVMGAAVTEPKRSRGEGGNDGF